MRPLKYWNGPRVEAEGVDGKERARRIPVSGLQRTSDAARRPFCLAPVGLRRFWRWPALLAWPRSLRISALRSRLGQRQKSTATRSIPVSQRSHKRSSICAIGFATSANPITTSATEVANTDSAWSWTGVNGLASPLVWWAILLIIASFISWLYVLRYIPITIAFPLSRVVDILVPLGCWIFLGELISPLRWCGIALVVIGLTLVAKPIAQIEERL